jgi:hypothetical protein
MLAMAVLKATTHPAEAQAFLKFVMSNASETRLTQAIQGPVRKGVTWATPMADGAAASTNATAVLDQADGGTALYAEYTKNVLYADVLPVFLGQATIAAFPAKISADAKAYWASH